MCTTKGVTDQAYIRNKGRFRVHVAFLTFKYIKKCNLLKFYLYGAKLQQKSCLGILQC